MHRVLYLVCFATVFSCSENEVEIKEERIFNGSYTLSNQQAVNDFVSLGYTTISGNLVIGSPVEHNSIISDLSSLRCITQIGGILLVKGNTSLTSLRGLENLIKVKGGIGIERNTMLQSMEALRAIDSLFILSIFDNSSIQNLRGFENLQNLQYLYIRENMNLKDFCDLNKAAVSSASLLPLSRIENNGYNPTLDDLINGNCKSE